MEVELRSFLITNRYVMINVANLSEDFPIWVSEETYESMKKKNRRGWSQCDTSIEWMVKLHYLRGGFKSGKISKAEFFQREQELVVRWWRRWI